MPARQQTDTVGADERTTIFFARVKDALFQFGTRLGLFAKAGRDDDERTRTLLFGHQFHVVWTVLGSHHQDGQFRRRQFLGIVESFDALYLVLLGIDDAQRSLVTALQ